MNEEMADLITFLRARLDEDEHWAQMATAGWPPKAVTTVADDPEHYALMPTDITPSKATFILRHDPARVLREVEAKRAIVGAYESQRAARFSNPAVVDELRDVVQTLASVYTNHPDYQEWAADAPIGRKAKPMRQSTANGQQILIDAPGPGQVLLVVSDGPLSAARAIDRAQGTQGWDEVATSALTDMDNALAVERELARRGLATPPSP